MEQLLPYDVAINVRFISLLPTILAEGFSFLITHSSVKSWWQRSFNDILPTVVNLPLSRSWKLLVCNILRYRMEILFCNHLAKFGEEEGCCKPILSKGLKKYPIKVSPNIREGINSNLNQDVLLIDRWFNSINRQTDKIIWSGITYNY